MNETRGPENQVSTGLKAISWTVFSVYMLICLGYAFIGTLGCRNSAGICLMPPTGEWSAVLALQCVCMLLLTLGAAVPQINPITARRSRVLKTILVCCVAILAIGVLMLFPNQNSNQHPGWGLAVWAVTSLLLLIQAGIFTRRPTGIEASQPK